MHNQKLDLRVITTQPDEKKFDTSLLFVHGAWQGSWVWEENFLPYFTSKGFECHALNLRGHNGSPLNQRFRFVRIGHYVEDLAKMVDSLDKPPILISHSMGSLVAQKYLEKNDLPLSILLAPLPPEGVYKTNLRFIMRFPFSFLLTSLTMNLKYIVNSKKKTRWMFFTDDLSDEQLKEYYSSIQNESFFAYLGMLLFSRPKPKKIKTKTYLMGGTKDRIFTTGMVKKAARSYGVEPIFFDNLAHQLMLEPGWEDVADKIMKIINDENP